MMSWIVINYSQDHRCTSSLERIKEHVASILSIPDEVIGEATEQLTETISPHS